MPRYKYYCAACLDMFEAWHGIKDTLSECSSCGASDSLTRVPSTISDFKKIAKHNKVGDLTNEHIEESRKELDRMKKAAKNEDIKK